MWHFPEVVPIDDQAIETLSGIILTMSVLSTLQVVSAQTAQTIDTRSLLYAALGSTAAWGFVDAMLSLVTKLIDRTHTYQVVKHLREATNLSAFRERLRDEAPDYVVEQLDDTALRKIQGLLQSKANVKRPGLNAQDYLAALHIWLIVVSAVLPLALPFLLIDDPLTAFRVTQLVSVWIMFALGYSLGEWLGTKPIRSGLSFAAIGIVITIVCIALGG
ncbi:MAG TPA: hypothetical protein PLM98_09660 [Thiolinea sp.]|nr:hypothetical protein [Thiolinea sp.]